MIEMMKAVSVKQPWASMIADGDKDIETRTWYTAYRGRILIVSSKRPNDEGPAGVALAIANLVDCRPMTEADEDRACCDIYGAAFSWVLENVCPIEPFPVRGQLGIYNVDVTGKIKAKMQSDGSLF